MTAVLMGALLIHGLRPGPLMFADRPEFVAVVYVALFLALVFTLIFGFLLVRQFVTLMRTPKNILLIVIVLLCVVGAFAIRNNLSDIYIMISFGVIGYIMYKLDIPVAPLAFGLILGPILEENIRRSLILNDGSWSIFAERPIALIMLLLSVGALVYPIASQWIRARRTS